MFRILVFVAIAWLSLLPPFFTDGACTAELDRAVNQLTVNRKSVATVALARDYWNARQIPNAVISAQECRRDKPKMVDRCGPGEMVYAHVPVKNRICRIYRDDEIRVLLQYDDRSRLTRITTDMNPFRSLPLPWLGLMLHWGR